MELIRKTNLPIDSRTYIVEEKYREILNNPPKKDMDVGRMMEVYKDAAASLKYHSRGCFDPEEDFMRSLAGLNAVEELFEELGQTTLKELIEKDN